MSGEKTQDGLVDLSLDRLTVREDVNIGGSTIINGNLQVDGVLTGTRQAAVLGRMRITNQAISSVTKTTVLFDSNDGDTTIGNVPLSYDSGNGQFTNTSGVTTSFYITYSIYWGGSVGNRQIWIEKNGVDVSRYADTSYWPTVNGGGFITIANGEYFTLQSYHNQSGGVDIFGGTYNRSKIQITQIR